MTENSHIFHIMSFTCVLNINQFNCEQNMLHFERDHNNPFQVSLWIIINQQVLYRYAYINQFYCKNPEKNQEQKCKL